jgi:hypothetical protein
MSIVIAGHSRPKDGVAASLRGAAQMLHQLLGRTR